MAEATEPFDPYCKRLASEIPDVVESADIVGVSPAEYARDDGTYNPDDNLFCCDECYISIGMPSSARGWKAGAPTG